MEEHISAFPGSWRRQSNQILLVNGYGSRQCGSSISLPGCSRVLYYGAPSYGYRAAFVSVPHVRCHMSFYRERSVCLLLVGLLRQSLEISVMLMRLQCVGVDVSVQVYSLATACYDGSVRSMMVELPVCFVSSKCG